MNAQDQISLPVNRAFVVQLHAEAKLDQGQAKGRVEHIRSGQATHFQSMAELLAFMQQVLQALKGSIPQD